MVAFLGLRSAFAADDADDADDAVNDDDEASKIEPVKPLFVLVDHLHTIKHLQNFAPYVRI